MGDRVTDKKEGASWLPNDMEARAEFCAAYLVKTTVSDPGYLWCLNAGIGKGFYDRSYTLDVGFEQVKRDSGTYPGGGDGTSSDTTDNFFSVKVGRNNKKVIPGQNGRAKEGAVEDISESVVGIGWQNLGGGTRELGGSSFGLPSDSRKILYFGSVVGKGYQHYFKDSRLYIEPSLGLEMGTYYPLVDSSDLGEYFAASQNFAVRFSLKIGFGDQSSEPGEGKKWDAYDDFYTYYSDVNGFAQRFLRYKLYDGPAQGEKRFYEDLGIDAETTQLTEDVAPLLMVQSMFKSLGIANFSESCFEAHQSGSSNCYIRMGARTVAALATLAGGEAMLQDSLGDLAMLASAGLSISPVDSLTQLWAENAAAAALFLGGTLAGNANVAMSGFNWAQSVALVPDRRGLKKKKLQDQYLIKPYSYNIKGPAEGGGSTSVERRVYFNDEGTSDGLYTKWEVESHVISPQNIGARAENVAGGAEAYDLKMPTRSRAGAGYKFLWDNFSLSLDAYMFQDFSNSADTGAGVSALLAFEIETGWDIIKRFSLGVGLTGEAGFTGHPQSDPRLQVPFFIGVY